MENVSGFSLLAYIMDMLSRQGTVPVDILCDFIEKAVTQDEAMPYNAFKNTFEEALQLGKQMGIINIKNNQTYIPFNFQYYQIEEGAVRQLNLQKISIGGKRKKLRGRRQRPVKRPSSHRLVPKPTKSRTTRKLQKNPIEKAMKRHRCKCTRCLRCRFCRHS